MEPYLAEDYNRNKIRKYRVTMSSEMVPEIIEIREIDDGKKSPKHLILSSMVLILICIASLFLVKESPTIWVISFIISIGYFLWSFKDFIDRKLKPNAQEG